MNVQHLCARQDIAPQPMGRSVRQPRLFGQHMTRPVMMLIAGMGALPACGLFDPSDWEVRRGVLVALADDTLQLRLPATVTAGESATITIQTRGDSCVVPAHTASSLVGMVLTVEPYDSVRVGGDVICQSVPCGCIHAVDVAFPESGNATLRVVGLGGSSGAVVTMERALVVH